MRTSVELGPQLAVPVDDALGRPGGPGGEQDRRLVVGRPAPWSARRRVHRPPAHGCLASRRLSARERRTPLAGRRQDPAPGTRRAAAASAAGMPIRWSRVGAAQRPAIPRSPSPASATTIAAPARQQAYTAAVSSMPGRHQQRDPVAGLARPRRAQSGGERSRRARSSSANAPSPDACPAAASSATRLFAGSSGAAPSGRPVARARPGTGGVDRRTRLVRRPTPRRRRPPRGSSSVTRWRRPGIAVHVGVRQPVAAGRAGSARRRPGRAGPRAAAPVRRRARRARRDASSAPAGMSRPRAGCRRRSRRPPGAARAAPYGRREARRGPRAGSGGPGQRPWRRGRRSASGRTTSSRSAPTGPAGSAPARAAPAAGDGGVGQHDPGELVAVARGPAERDRAAPVVGDDDDRAGRCPSASVSRSEVVDPLGQRPRRRRSAPRSPCPSWSTATTRQPGGALGEEAPPQVGPGGLPWTHSSVAGGAGGTPLSSTCQVRGTPSASATRTVRDQAGSSPGSRATLAARDGALPAAVTRRSRRTRCSGPSRCPAAGRDPAGAQAVQHAGPA